MDEQMTNFSKNPLTKNAVRNAKTPASNNKIR